MSAECMHETIPETWSTFSESTSHMYQLLLESGLGGDDDVKPNPAAATRRIISNPTSAKIEPVSKL